MNRGDLPTNPEPRKEPMQRIARNIALFCAVGMLGQFSLWGQAPSEQNPFDVVILHGHILDGTGSPWYSGDVGIRDGHIAAIGDLGAASAKQKIDAQGKVVAPGFIDMLGQSELTTLSIRGCRRRFTKASRRRLREKATPWRP
jgi:Urease alpha-subunit, N-terminal domain